METSFDYIVIGSGFGGSVSAMRLAEKGYSVLVLEKGKEYSSKDFPKTNLNLFKYLWIPALKMHGFQKLTFFKDASILSGVGGGSLVYANTLFHPPEEFFTKNKWSKFGAQIISETLAEKIFYKGGKYYLETKSSTNFLFKRRKTFQANGIIISGGVLGTMELLLKQKYTYKTLPLLSEKLGHEVRTNSETLCAVSGANEKLNNGLAITSVFNPDSNTHVEIVKYPDWSNAMK